MGVGVQRTSILMLHNIWMTPIIKCNNFNYWSSLLIMSSHKSSGDTHWATNLYQNYIKAFRAANPHQSKQIYIIPENELSDWISSPFVECH